MILYKAHLIGLIMDKIKISIHDSKEFNTYDEVLVHIYENHLATETVKSSYLNALREREANYPTGIKLDGYSVAIPHCDIKHANKPTIYIIRLPKPVLVNRADEDEKLSVSLVINLVVTDPSAQLMLLRSLFHNLQDVSFYQKLLKLPIEEADSLFVSTIINQ